MADFADPSMSGMLATLPRGDGGTRKVGCSAGESATGVNGVLGVLVRGGTLDDSVDLSCEGVDFVDSSREPDEPGKSVEEEALSVALVVVGGPTASPKRDAGLRGGGGGGGGSDMAID